MSAHALPAALAALASLSARYDHSRDRIVIAAPDGPNTLQEALGRLALDDVFLALTRQPDRSPTGAAA